MSYISINVKQYEGIKEMIPSKKIQIFYIIVFFLIFLPMQIPSASSMTVDTSQKFLDALYSNTAPAHMQMDYYIQKYAKQEGIPLYIAYNVAKLESGYNGPNHISYNPSVTSSADAEGAMQILLSTAREVTGNKSLTREELRMNVELNVRISMKYLNQLYSRYGSWKLATGYYNTGYPIINDYANNVVK